MTSKSPKTRKWVPLTSEELDHLSAVRAGDNYESTAFTDITGVRVGDRTSEAEVLSALVRIGCAAVTEKASELSYRRAAEVDARDPERTTWRNNMRRQRHMRSVTGEGSSA